MDSISFSDCYERALSGQLKALKNAARDIRLLICDVDGVLTDGRLYFGEEGELVKAFHVHDGLGLQLLKKQSVDVGIISARQSKIVDERARVLGIEHVFQGQHDKSGPYRTLTEQLGLQDSQVAYVGDDLPDVTLIRRVGLGVAVANAPMVVQRHADWVTCRCGGQGAVREVVEFILWAQGKLDDALVSYET